MPIHIAIAEDKKKHAQLMQELIQNDSNYMVDAIVTNGKEMISYLHSCKAIPNVVIIDYEMNPCDGAQLAFYIHLHFKEIKLLAFSAHIDTNAINIMYANGCMGYKNKYLLSLNTENLKHLLQFEAEEFLKAINVVANSSFYIDSYFTKQNLYAINKETANTLNNAQTKNIFSILKTLKLSSREYQILFLFCIGFTIKEIANSIYIAQKTVENHIATIEEKLDAYNQRDLVHQAYRHQIIPSASYMYINKYNGGVKLN